MYIYNRIIGIVVMIVWNILKKSYLFTTVQGYGFAS